jgi:hypothetical protein
LEVFLLLSVLAVLVDILLTAVLAATADIQVTDTEAMGVIQAAIGAVTQVTAMDTEASITIIMDIMDIGKKNDFSL